MTTITLTKGQVQGIKDAPEERRRTSKQSKGPAGMTEKELKESKIGKRMSKKRFLEELKRVTPKTGDTLLLKPEMMGKDIGLMKDGGLAEATAKLKAKGFEDGGMVVKDKVVAIDKSPNSGLITVKGFGAGRRT